jgi:hypothetical protein
MHAAKHVWNTLIWISDIGLAMQQSLDWRRLQVLATMTGTLRICATSFEFAKLIGYPIPEEAARLFRDERALGIAKILATRLFTERQENFTRMDHQLFLESRERMRDQLAYLWRLGTAPDLYVNKPGLAGRMARITKVARREYG